MYAIQTNKLRKDFGDFTALNDINLEIPEGVCYGLLGLNGAGKTTTIKCILGLLKPTSGSITIFGEKRTLSTNQYIGYLPERLDFHKHITLNDFMAYVGLLNLIPKSEIKSQTEDLLEFVGLGGWGNATIGTLSAGMKQRLGFAQSLMGYPKLIILDEPTSNLDPLGRDEMLKKIKTVINQGITVFTSSHILSEIEKVSDYIGIIANGVVLKQGELKEIKEEAMSKGAEIEIIVDKPQVLIPALEELGYITNIVKTNNNILIETSNSAQLGRTIPKILVENDIQLIQYLPKISGLQDIFLKIMEESVTATK
ncbi:MAG: ABC transporter ATP-binding protein [Candidatus Helarchaeota archaeon]